MQAAIQSARPCAGTRPGSGSTPSSGAQISTERDQVQGVLGDVDPLVPQGQVVDRRQVSAEQHDREQRDRAGRAGQHRHRARVQPARQPPPAVAATGEQRQPDRPARGQQRRHDQPHHHVLDHVRRKMVVGQRTDPRVEVDDQDREPADEARAAAQRPAAPPPVTAPADLGGEQVDHAGCDRQQRERQADRPVGAPLGGERVQAHLDRPTRGPTGRSPSCSRRPAGGSRAGERRRSARRSRRRSPRRARSCRRAGDRAS